MRDAPFAAIASLLIALTMARPAAGDPQPSLDLRYFQPPTAPDGTLYLEPAMTPGPGQWNAGAWLSWAYRSVALRANGQTLATLLEHQLSVDAVGSLGIGERAAIGLAIPAALYQTGESAPAVVAGMGESSLPSAALGDVAVTGKVTIVPYNELGGFGLAALARVTLPTGARTSYLGEGSLTSELRLLGEFNLIAVSLQGTTGFKLRTEQRSFVGETWGNEIPWGAALVVRPQAFGLDSAGRWTWALEAHGALPAGPEAPFTNVALSPALIGASARYGFNDVSLVAGVEGPLDRAAGVPLVRVLTSVQWAPRTHDQDGDGIEDDIDECLELAEDRDGFEDSDGCPDFDNDDDGVPDPDDRCPDSVEDLDEFQDEDGCIDPDNDQDGIADQQDACPNTPGQASQDPAKNGCPVTDRDGDKVLDSSDKCPDEPEDIDGFEDDDGCIDRDNDGDQVPDAEDRCPLQAGVAFAPESWRGCPVPDADGDMLLDAEDQCPQQSETYNGIRDDDGCPDEGGLGLVTVRTTPTAATLQVRVPMRFTGSEEQPTIEPRAVVRAIASELVRNQWNASVGCTGQPQPRAEARASAIAQALNQVSWRSIAEAAPWQMVKDQPRIAGTGCALLLRTSTTPLQEPRP